MSATWGEKLKVTIFGESHGAAIGVVIDGLPAGFKPDFALVDDMMARRSAKGKEKIATARREGDEYEIVSGFFNGAATGTPLAAIIRNKDTHSPDYERMRYLMRPGHSDWGYFVKEGGFNDYRGGGHSSGRLTAPLVFAGAICKQVLSEKGIKVGTHIASIAGVEDVRFAPIAPQIDEVGKNGTISEQAWEAMRDKVLEAAKKGDSVGGVIECAVTGVPAGVGDPFFDSLESRLAHMMFSVPAVKGIQFGKGYALTRMNGSGANDPFRMQEGKVVTSSNNNGGILGGIATGMPVIFDVAIKPTSSIFIEQDTIDVSKMENAKLQVKGRHDPCIAVRAAVVIEAAASIAILDSIL